MVAGAFYPTTGWAESPNHLTTKHTKSAKGAENDVPDVTLQPRDVEAAQNVDHRTSQFQAEGPTGPRVPSLCPSPRRGACVHWPAANLAVQEQDREKVSGTDLVFRACWPSGRPVISAPGTERRVRGPRRTAGAAGRAGAAGGTRPLC